MLTTEYFTKMKEVLERIEDTQIDAIYRSASAITDALINDGVWHIMDTGHMLMYEAIGRSGGLMAVRPVRVSVNVDNPVRPRARSVSKKRVFMDSINGLPGFIVDKSNMLPGDVLLIGSVSGISVLCVEMAICARNLGVTVIGLTSLEYSRHLDSMHPGGKKLFEVSDIVIDNCSDIGDTLVHVDELGQGICPSSGIAASYIVWAIQARVVELLLEKGKKPHIYMSNHLDGAERFNALAWDEYEKVGY
ncbi:MAG TPA: sugar isomerase domain-containing protein [Bacillota bacterium]|nr:sugar isomerase domain-containing protein [Bacillota bacterium]